MVADGGGNGLDFDALLQRIHPAESRINRLAAETPSSFVAFDLLADGDTSLLEVPMVERRAALLAAVTENDVGAHHARRAPIGPSPTIGSTGSRVPGLDGIVAKPLDGTYQPGKRALIKVKHQRTADCAVAGYRIHKDGKGVGSLLLGLFDDDGQMHSVGVAASFSREAPRRTPRRVRAAHARCARGHPWREWAEYDGDAAGAATGGGSRWNAGKDMSFVPLKMGLVAEVSFGQLEGGRFRHGVGFLRWRPDRTPESCTYDQLDVAEPVSFHDFVTST